MNIGEIFGWIAVGAMACTLIGAIYCFYKCITAPTAKWEDNFIDNAFDAVEGMIKGE